MRTSQTTLPETQQEANPTDSSAGGVSASVRSSRESKNTCNVAAAAENIGCSVGVVYSAIKSGGLKSTIADNGITVILKSDLKAWNASRGTSQRGEGTRAKAQPLAKKGLLKGAKKRAGKKSVVAPAAAESKAISKPKLRKVLLTDILRDPDLQVRAEISNETVIEYKEAMEKGEQLPPVVLFHHEGKYNIADGWHRILAADACNLEEIAAHVHEGSRKDALKYALKANTTNGLRRTNADKLRALKIACKEFGKCSNRVVAAMCAVTEGFVRKYIANCVPCAPDEARLGADGKMHPATKSRPPEVTDEVRQKVVEKSVARFCTHMQTLTSIELLRRVRDVADARIRELPSSEPETQPRPDSESPQESDLDTPPLPPTKGEWGPID